MDAGGVVVELNFGSIPAITSSAVAGTLVDILLLQWSNLELLKRHLDYNNPSDQRVVFGVNHLAGYYRANAIVATGQPSLPSGAMRYPSWHTKAVR